MSHRHLGIIPLGAVYFGDGRPTSAGESGGGRGRFPPTPRTIQGFIRTSLLQAVPGITLGANGDRNQIRQLVGEPDRLPDGWQILGPWLAAWKEVDATSTPSKLTAVAPWTPIPRFLAITAQRTKLAPLQLRSPTPQREDARSPRPEFLWDKPEASPLCCSIPEARPRSGYLHPTALLALLNGNLRWSREHWCLGPPPFVEEEPQTGIEIDPETQTASEGMLYTFGFRRMRSHSGLLASFQGQLAGQIPNHALDAGVTALGGRARLARLAPVSSEADFISDWNAALTGDHLPQDMPDGFRFWIWLTTPAAITDPSRPRLYRSKLGSARIDILSASLGPLESMGGYSFANRGGQAARAYVPAGSAWLAVVRGGSSEERAGLVRSLHHAVSLGSVPAESAFGFGHTFVCPLPTISNRNHHE